MLKNKKTISIIGTGLVALDVILNGNPETPPIYQAGGSCGNVLTISSYLGSESFPIARLANNRASQKLIEDMIPWGVKTDFVFQEHSGSTPIIIQRMKYKPDGTVVHKFEFRDPETGNYLPSYKPLLANSVDDITNKKSKCDYFYFDRLSRSTIDLAKYYKSNGAITVFEPSSLKSGNEKFLEECRGIVDVLKFSHDRIPDFKERYPDGIAKVEIETLGANGVNFRIIRNVVTKWHHLQPFAINGVKDTAGAGDWCTSGIILGIGKIGKPFNKILLSDWKNILGIGQSLGAVSCFFTGARGLMYNVKAESVIKLTSLLLEQKTLSINDIKGHQIGTKVSSSHESISSLIERI